MKSKVPVMDYYVVDPLFFHKIEERTKGDSLADALSLLTEIAPRIRRSAVPVSRSSSHSIRHVFFPILSDSRWSLGILCNLPLGPGASPHVVHYNPANRPFKQKDGEVVAVERVLSEIAVHFGYETQTVVALDKMDAQLERLQSGQLIIGFFHNLTILLRKVRQGNHSCIINCIYYNGVAGHADN